MLEQGESEKEINQLGPSRVSAVLCPVLAVEGPGIWCKGYQSLFFFSCQNNETIFIFSKVFLHLL